MKIKLFLLVGIAIMALHCGGSSSSNSNNSGNTNNTGVVDSQIDEATDIMGEPENDTGEAYPATIGEVKIAKWKYNKKAALLMYFDDSTYGQAQLGIPLLNKLKLVGTFFVNPGSQPYKDNKETWEFFSQKRGGGCQELANHSMNHHGAADYDEADSEIGDPSKIIWTARGQEENASFIAFNRGGGTGWNITDDELLELLNKYRNINRLKNYIGEPMVGTQILPGSNSDTILRNKQEALDETKILMLSFHGIAKENGNPPKDWGNGAVYIEEFKKAMNNLKNQESHFWSAGYIQMHKYIWERKMTTPSLVKNNEKKYTINFTRDTSILKTEIKSQAFYNEPVTLLVKLPHWVNNCKVFQNDKVIPFAVTDGKLKINALPFTDQPVTIELPDFFVSKTGNDSATGNHQSPFKTIKKAIAQLSDGGLIVVKDGDYKEYINIKKSGTAQRPIEIMAENKHGAKVLGFRILQNNGKNNGNIKISGFEIESDMNYPNDKTGIKSYGAYNVEISNCKIHDCPSGGIAILKNSSKTIITNNDIEHNGCYGILLDGDHGLIKRNSISKTVQNHRKFTDNNLPVPKGADADGIVIFGNNHEICKNEITDLASPEEENTNPHSDAIQSSSNGNNTVLQDSKIYQNYIRISYKSGKGIILEANKKAPCKNIVIANNIIEFTDIGVNASTPNGTYQNIKVYNNVFKSGLNQKAWGTAIFIKNVQGYAFENNITVDCKNEHRKIVGGSGTVGHNLSYNSDNSSFSLTPPKQSDELKGVDPEFETYTGKHGENDYHLKATSPALGKGKILSGDKSIVQDFTGKPRSNSSWSMGAYSGN